MTTNISATPPLRVPLNGTPEQFARLSELQATFADVCNDIAPIVQSSRCWNRVALHHLVYRTMRERYPALGSQMICNAVYSVSRTARLVLQDPASPWNVAKRGPDAPLPRLRFAPDAPVYFDRHTLSIKGTVLSMFTLDGRMRFDLQLKPEEIARFHDEKVIEIVLALAPPGFALTFQFDAQEPGPEPGPRQKGKARDHADTSSEVSRHPDKSEPRTGDTHIPHYLQVIPPEVRGTSDMAEALAFDSDTIAIENSAGSAS